MGEPEIFPRVLSLTAVSLLYIGVFFAIGTVISTYLDNSKTALIVAFTVWVLAVLIAPRVGFLAAKVIAPTQTSQSVYLEKTAARDNFNAELEAKKVKIIQDFQKGQGHSLSSISMEEQIASGKEIDKLVKPLEEEFRQKFKDHADQIDRNYQREKKRQEQVGETLSRITPTSSLIYFATNLTQTGKRKRSNYFQAGDRYYDALHADLFSKIVDHATTRMFNPATDIVKITQPPPLETPTLAETFRQSVVDALLLCFFGVALTTVAFLKFFRSDI